MKAILFCLLVLFISCRPSYKEIVNYILPKEYNFKIISCKESNMLYFEGSDRDGNIVRHDIPDFWDIKEYYNIGDSIVKRKGEKNLKIVKPDTVIILHLGGKDGPLSEEEQDSILRLLKEGNVKENK